ncbi:MAG: acylphosphatase [Planctomycetota bacterium]|nr:acylphosphatase [Planctomycetota bacterium]
MTHRDGGSGNLTRARVTYSGRVQGVGFRATVRSIASGHPITGWVRNDPAGTVTLEAQGAATDVEGFLAAVRGGAPGYIASERRENAELAPDESGFEIRR